MKIIVNIGEHSSKPRPEITWSCTYKFRDATGRLVFEHRRFKTNDQRGKTFSYRHPDPDLKGAWVKGKPAGADDLLWMVPTILEHPREEWWWTEGEKDAKALYEAGVWATSHHGAAVHTTLAQARWLAQARRVVLVADRDTPGAACALRRRGLLEKAGVPRERIRIVQARKGKDAFDHLAAGYSVEEFVPVNMRRLKHEAAQYDHQSATESGYRYARITVVRGGKEYRL